MFAVDILTQFTGKTLLSCDYAKLSLINIYNVILSKHFAMPVFPNTCDVAFKLKEEQNIV